MTLEQIVPVLQLSISPVIVISGAGLVLLSMTNRFGRVIDRARILAQLLRTDSSSESHQVRSQLLILTRRARLLRVSIALASLSLLLAAFLVIGLFIVALMNLEAASLIIILFISCMSSLILGLLFFIADVNVSLSALQLETELEKDGNC
ncbi:MAG: DUF2721 domain-containing protein [Proteobacteria bacterium]|nr:DUF2721 domain-containing protein [Pseudomonadota bacterium]MBU1736502.1 DUF2721 domain-containing protein [Pseudomonadota bacterium]